ncbi:MAG: threonylcarbamoyl-AMP synthase [Oscillospiraceae bacterium]|nr:threonylcarbamoyl-AMP synthase [Oscillospiraceae bacterium]
MKTVIISDGDISYAARLISEGRLVAVPTETVYGLSADGLCESAVEEIYNVKGRPETKPISLLVSDIETVEHFCDDIPQEAYILAEKFWPGPLTMILRKKSIVPDIVTAGGSTVGVRCPDHPLTLELLKTCGKPLATPSANISGMPSPKSADEVLSYFDGKIPCVIDGGKCSVGIESTIVDMTVTPPKILRQGGLLKKDIETALGTEVM